MPGDETYAIRLPDGTLAVWTAERIAAYEDDWSVSLATASLREWATGYSRLLHCLLHDDNVTCGACTDD